MGRLLLADGVVDLEAGVVARGGVQHRLTPNERELLVYLGARAGRDVPRDELHQRVWGHAARVVSRAVTISVHRLRRKIERDPDRPTHLVTGQAGYRWVPVGQAAVAGPVVLVLALRSPPGGADWLASCAEVARSAGVYLVELAPDRALFAAHDVEVATALCTALVGPDVRIGAAAGPADCLVDPVSGRTLYGGALLERADRLARVARSGAAPAAIGSDEVGADPPAPSRPPLIGRSAELAELRACLAGLGEDHVLAIVGPPGVGKTRLAAELADDALVVAIDGATGVSDVVDAVAGALGLGAQRHPEAVSAALAARAAAVLVLDGADGVSAELEAVVVAIGGGPDLRRVVTCRERPTRTGTVVVELGGLSPAEGAALVQRRCPDLPEQALGPLVEALDGLPLALELVAPRLRTVPAAELARPDRLAGVLFRGRDSTLARAFRFSWERLDRFERRMLVQATAFAGPFGLDDAEAVLGSDAADAPWFVDTLQSLCDRSWLQRRVDGGDVRFSLLATVRAFADGEAAAWLGDAPVRHARHVASRWGEMPALGPPPFGAALLPELDRAARTALRVGDEALAVRTATAFAHGAQFFGGADAALRTIELVLASAVQPRSRARLAQSRGQLLRRSGRPEAALEAVTLAVAAAEEAGDADLVGRIAMFHGLVALSLRDAAGASAAFDRAEAGIRPGSDAALALALNRVTACHAAGAFREGLERVGPLTAASHPQARAYGLALAGAMHAGLGELPAAIDALAAGVSALEAHGEGFSASNFRLLWAEALAGQGRDAEAAEAFAGALRTLGALGNAAYAAVTCVKLAELALAADDLPQAERWTDEGAVWAGRCTDAAAQAAVASARCEVLTRSGAADRGRAAGLEAEAWVARCDRSARGQLCVHRAMAAAAEARGAEAAAWGAEAEAIAAELGALPHSALGRAVRRMRRGLSRVAPH